MGKKNSKTLQQKIKKDAERNAIRKAKIERALQEASVQIPFYPDSLMIERCQPEPSTVIFRGLTESIAFAIQDFMPSNFTETPLDDFYASIRTDTGKSLHLHWVPFESPVSRFATYHYCVVCAKERLESLDANPSFGMNKQVFNKRFVNQVFGFDKLTPESLKATVYIEYEGVRTFCFVFINHEEKKRLCILTPSVSQYELERKDEEKLQAIRQAFNSIEEYIFTIQYIVTLYLNGEELPKLELEPNEDDKKPGPKKPYKQHEPSEPKEHSNCIAYIHYSARDRKMTISNSSRTYKMKWWIVSGHRRHYKTGKIVEVPPYIKGDKDDPDALNALEMFKNGFQKIQYFHLVARKPK